MLRSNSGKDPTSPQGYLSLAVVTVAWGLSWPANKFALTVIPPWSYRAWGLILAGLGVLVLAKVMGLKLVVPRAERRPLILLAFLNITGWHLFSAFGIQLLPAGRAVIVAFAMPIWAAILGVFILGETFTRSRLAGLVLGMAGLAVLIGPEIKALGAVPLGLVYMLGSSVTWALGTVLLKRQTWTIPPLILSGWQLLIGAVPCLIGALIIDPVDAMLHIPWPNFLAMLFISFFSILVGYWAWFKALALLPAGLASLGTVMIPIVGVFSSAWVLGERVGVFEYIALGLVVAALGTVLFNPQGNQNK